jgi:hypothetical protein
MSEKVYSRISIDHYPFALGINMTIESELSNFLKNSFIDYHQEENNWLLLLNLNCQISEKQFHCLPSRRK